MAKRKTSTKKSKGMRTRDMVFFGVLGATSIGMLGLAYYLSQRSGIRKPLKVHTVPPQRQLARGRLL